MTTTTSSRPHAAPEAREPDHWIRVASTDAIPPNGGACVKVGDLQIAVFNFRSRDAWYACQNLCPHKMEMALSRGLLGSAGDTPKVACPYHKAAFSLTTGACLNAELDAVTTYPVRIENGQVHIGLTDADADGVNPFPDASASGPKVGCDLAAHRSEPGSESFE